MEVVSPSSVELTAAEARVGLAESELMDQDQARTNALAVMEREAGPLSEESALTILEAVDRQYEDELSPRVHQWLEDRLQDLAPPGSEAGRVGAIVAGVAGALISDMWARGAQPSRVRLDSLRGAWVQMFDAIGPQLLELEAGEPACRICGCTENRACMTDAGPCSWVEPDLCSNPSCIVAAEGQGLG